MATQPITTTAIVCDEPIDGHVKWRKETLQLREPLEDEVLVRILASGICHTDIGVSSYPSDTPGFSAYPKVLGHEGAGIIERVGSEVLHVKKGDWVLLSFDYCGKCRGCAEHTPGYCEDFHVKNLLSEQNVYQDTNGKSIAGSFFGQSSFSNLALVKGTSAVNVSHLVKDKEELKLFAPLGCGMQTGAGAVTQLADVGQQDAIAVFGLGGVGLSAVMAAKMRGAKAIIGVDKVQSRLELAKELGATHVIDTSTFTALTTDLARAIREAVPLGTNASFDTTGIKPIIDAGIQGLHRKGQMVLIGVVDGTLSVDLGTLLISDDFETALNDMHSGATVKPILLW
ncbi:GroES-like protein [Phaeosphaeriaceae sp. SRC1lsM3a]|nr:GroES-like protein [Stagonospora sp. SRC1lsM3a]